MNAMLYDPELLNLPIHESNSELFLVFEKYAEEILAKQTKKESYSHKVARLINANAQ